MDSCIQCIKKKKTNNWKMVAVGWRYAKGNQQAYFCYSISKLLYGNKKIKKRENAYFLIQFHFSSATFIIH